MRRLGRELHADPTAVYRHFASKDELLVAMAERMFAEPLAEPCAAEGWRDALRRILHSGFAIYQRHPGVAVALARTPDDLPALVEHAERVAVELYRAGLGEEDGARALNAIFDVVAGVGLFRATTPTFSTIEHRAAMRTTFAELDERTHPALRGLADHLYPPRDDVLGFLVELLLDGIEQRAGRRGAVGVEEQA